MPFIFRYRPEGQAEYAEKNDELDEGEYRDHAARKLRTELIGVAMTAELHCSMLPLGMDVDLDLKPEVSGVYKADNGKNAGKYITLFSMEGELMLRTDKDDKAEAKADADVIIKDMMDILAEKYPDYDFRRISWEPIAEDI